MPERIAKSGYAVGLNKGHIVTPKQLPVKPVNKKGVNGIF
jgi:hypothetical protein